MENPSDDVISPDASNAVSVPEATGAENPTQTTEQPVQTAQQVQQDRPQLNVEAEWRRKYTKLVEDLPNMVDKVIQEKSASPQQPQYTVSQLESYAQQNPEYRAWVEEQKEILREQKFEQKLKSVQESERKRVETETSKQRALYEVVSDPRFAEAFTVTPTGAKDWNFNSPLTIRINEYLLDPDLKNRPDAVLIAAKLAKADFIGAPTQQGQQLSSLKRENEKLKNQTLVEGSGRPVVQKPRNEIAEAMAKVAQSGRLEDATEVIRARLRAKREKRGK